MYRVKNWDDIYENSESKKYKKLSWVATPNKHEGNGWGRMVANKKKVELFCGWNLIIQIASKCQPRGSLMTDRGPLTPEDMQYMTGFPKSLFTTCLEFFAAPKIGWLESAVSDPETQISEDLRKSPGISESSGHTQNNSEQNRKELVPPISPKGFGEFWETYPKKVGKDAALKAWKKAKPDIGIVLKALSWQKIGEQWTKEGGQFVPNPATYINQGRWKDEPPQQPTGVIW